MLKITRNLPNSLHPRCTFRELPDDLVAHRFQVIGTAIFCYTLYRKVEQPFPAYSEVLGQHDIFPNCWLADVTSQRLPPVVKTIASRMDRIHFIRAFYQDIEDRAEATIRHAFHEDFEEEFTVEWVHTGKFEATYKVLALTQEDAENYVHDHRLELDPVSVTPLSTDYERYL